jgi:prophage antirepressor-like protein
MNTPTKNIIIPFNFNANEVRAILINSEPWFVASEIAKALGYRDAHDMTRMLDEDERGTHNVRIGKSNQYAQSFDTQDKEVTIINESGLYSCILKSRKPEAKQFKKWVTSEVLPSIRKTGSYATPTEDASKDLFLNTAHVRQLARKKALSFFDTRKELVKKINTPEALALGLPLADEQIAEGVISDILTAGRFLLNFDGGGRMQVHQMHPNDIVINPNNVISAILDGRVHKNNFPSILGAIAHVLEVPLRNR